MPRGVYDRATMRRNGDHQPEPDFTPDDDYTEDLSQPAPSPAPVTANTPPVAGWLGIREVHRSDVPSDNPWWPLYADLLKRLERTPNTLFLCVSFADNQTATDALAALDSLFSERLGANAVIVQKFANDPDNLYVQRGSSYAYADSKRRRGPKLPGSSDDADFYS